MSSLERWHLFRVSFIERFHCVCGMLQVNCFSVQPIVQMRFPGFPGDYVGREDGLNLFKVVGSIIPSVASSWGVGGGVGSSSASMHTHDRQSCTYFQ